MTALGAPGGPEREVWRLLYLEDHTVAEVAELTGVPEGTVKSRGGRSGRPPGCCARRAWPGRC